MRSNVAARALFFLGVVSVALLSLSPAEGAKPPANVDISLNQVTVATNMGFTTVTANVTNNSNVRVNIEVNVIALLCDDAACDADATMNECFAADTQGTEGSLGPGQTADFTVIFALDPGNYIFRTRAVGTKGGAEDRKFAIVTAILP